MNKLFAVLVLAGLTFLSFAGDLVIKSGKVYQNYVIMGVAPNGIRVFYNNGDGDRQVILPPSEFPDEHKETVNRLVRNIPAARRQAMEDAKQARADKAASKKRALDEKKRLKKSDALLKKEMEQNKKIQEQLKKKAGTQKKTSFLKK